MFLGLWKATLCLKICCFYSIMLKIFVLVMFFNLTEENHQNINLSFLVNSGLVGHRRQGFKSLGFCFDLTSFASTHWLTFVGRDEGGPKSSNLL